MFPSVIHLVNVLLYLSNGTSGKCLMINVVFNGTKDSCIVAVVEFP